MTFPAQTPATNRPCIAYNLPTKTHTRGSEEIDRFLTALSDNRFAPTPTSGLVPTPTDSAHPLYSTWERLEGLYDLEENWNGYDVAAPNPDAIEHAKNWIQRLYGETKTEGHRWISPHVTANEEGNAVFEWSRGKKRLAVYISPDDAVYIKAWGLSVVNEMSDGEAMSSESRFSLWTWLLEQ